MAGDTAPLPGRLPAHDEASRASQDHHQRGPVAHRERIESDDLTAAGGRSAIADAATASTSKTSPGGDAFNAVLQGSVKAGAPPSRPKRGRRTLRHAGLHCSQRVGGGAAKPEASAADASEKPAPVVDQAGHRAARGAARREPTRTRRSPPRTKAMPCHRRGRPDAARAALIRASRGVLNIAAQAPAKADGERPAAGAAAASSTQAGGDLAALVGAQPATMVFAALQRIQKALQGSGSQTGGGIAMGEGLAGGGKAHPRRPEPRRCRLSGAARRSTSASSGPGRHRRIRRPRPQRRRRRAPALRWRTVNHRHRPQPWQAPPIRPSPPPPRRRPPRRHGRNEAHPPRGVPSRLQRAMLSAAGAAPDQGQHDSASTAETTPAPAPKPRRSRYPRADRAGRSGIRHAPSGTATSSGTAVRPEQDTSSGGRPPRRDGDGCRGRAARVFT